MAGGLVIAIVSHYTAHLFEQLSQRQFRLLVISLLLIMVTVQCLLLWAIPLTIYHDPFRVLDQAVQLAHHHYQWQSTYFWRYPNNVCLTYFLSRWLIVTDKLGLSVNLSLAILEIVTLDGLIGLLLLTVHHLSKRRSMVVDALLFLMVTPFAYTYYLTVFYSDTLIMLIIMAIIAILIYWPQLTKIKRWLVGSLLLSLTACGILIKASLIVIVPAMLLTVLTVQKYRHQLGQLKAPLIAILVGVAVALPLQAIVYRSANFHPNQDYQFPVSAWVSMGLNTHSRGTYSDHDVAKLVQIKHYRQRSRVANQRLGHRVHRLGIPRILKQVIIKTGILLNGANIGQWYNGGAREAPAWYQSRLVTILEIIAVTYQMALAALYWLVIGRLLHWQGTGSAHHFFVASFSVLLALGFLAFYACLWEVEERYGQVIIPLLLVFLASSKPGNVVSSCRNIVGRVAATAVLTIIALMSGAATQLTGSAQTNTLANAKVVAAQRAQLSTTYNARPDVIKPRQIISQEIILNRPAKRVSVQTYPGAQTSGKLISLSTHRHYLLTKSGPENLVGYYHLPAGKYRIEVANHTQTAQPQAVVHVHGYRLAPHSLQKDGQHFTDASLIYKITAKIKPIKNA